MLDACGTRRRDLTAPIGLTAFFNRHHHSPTSSFAPKMFRARTSAVDAYRVLGLEEVGVNLTVNHVPS